MFNTMLLFVVVGFCCDASLSSSLLDELESASSLPRLPPVRLVCWLLFVPARLRIDGVEITVVVVRLASLVVAPAVYLLVP